MGVRTPRGGPGGGSRGPPRDSQGLAAAAVLHAAVNLSGPAGSPRLCLPSFSLPLSWQFLFSFSSHLLPSSFHPHSLPCPPGFSLLPRSRLQRPGQGRGPHTGEPREGAGQPSKNCARGRGSCLEAGSSSFSAVRNPRPWEGPQGPGGSVDIELCPHPSICPFWTDGGSGPP